MNNVPIQYDGLNGRILCEGFIVEHLEFDKAHTLSSFCSIIFHELKDYWLSHDSNKLKAFASQ